MTAVSSAVIACVLIWPIVQSLMIGVVVMAKRTPDLFGTIVGVLLVMGLPILVSLRYLSRRRGSSAQAQ